MMKRTFYVLISTIFVLIGSPVSAATRTAATCNANDVQNAMNLAVAGDTVQIPAGTCHWTTQVNWTAPANVILLGTGNLTVTGGASSTIIVNDFVSGSLQPMMTLTPNASGTFRMAGITIQFGSGSTADNGIIAVFGTGTQTRIDHNTWDMTTIIPNAGNNNGQWGKYLLVGGLVRGVIDHNVLDPNAALGWIHVVNGNSNDSGDLMWSQATGFGSSNFIFLEDNVINGVVNTFFNPPTVTASLTDCHTGGRFVVRFNTLNAATPSQTHPTGHAGHDRGCRAHENYGNTVTPGPLMFPADQGMFAFDYNNSGPGLIWGNSFDQVFNNIVYLNDCRSNQGCGYTQQPVPNGWGYCGTNFNGTGSTWDQNSDVPTGYACLDMPGRGQGDLLSGGTEDFPQEHNVPLGGQTWPRQALEPIYEWLDTGDIVTGQNGNWVSAAGVFQQNRDYYLYHGNSSCNQGAGSCTAGVGSGTRAQRPVNCTAGVAWWSTDQGGDWNKSNMSANDGTLDKCTATNTWTNAFYTPFTYPHPLVGPGGGGGGGTIQVGPAEIVVTTAARQNVGLNFWPDGHLGVQNASGVYTFWGPNDGNNATSKTVGTLANPIATSVNPFIPIQNPVASFNYQAGGPIYFDSGSNTILLMYHAERWPNGDASLFWGSLGIAKSSDGGATWFDTGEFLQPNYPFNNNNTVNVEPGGGQFVINNGFFYVYYNDRLANTTLIQTCVARASTSSVITAALNGVPASWSKWNGSSFSQPGLGGTCTTVNPGQNAWWQSVQADTASQKYIMAWCDFTNCFYQDSTDGLAWTNLLQITNDGGENIYTTLVGTATDPSLLGASFYVYYVQSNSGGFNRWTDAVLKRRLITVPTAPPGNPPNCNLGTTGVGGGCPPPGN